MHYGGGARGGGGIPRGGRPLTRSEGEPVRSRGAAGCGDSCSRATGAAASVGLLATAADGGAGPQAPSMDTPASPRPPGAYIFSAPEGAEGSRGRDVPARTVKQEERLLRSLLPLGGKRRGRGLSLPSWSSLRSQRKDLLLRLERRRWARIGSGVWKRASERRKCRRRRRGLAVGCPSRGPEGLHRRLRRLPRARRRPQRRWLVSKSHHSQEPPRERTGSPSERVSGRPPRGIPHRQAVPPP